MNNDKLPTLIKENSINYNNEKFKKLNSPEYVVKMLNDVFNLSNMTEEYVYELCLDSKGKPIGIFEISHGTIRGAACSNREIFMKALLCNAGNIIIIHNHPSGNSFPSREDHETMNNIKKGAVIMDINLLDFIIMGEKDSYYSFKEKEII